MMIAHPAWPQPPLRKKQMSEKKQSWRKRARRRLQLLLVTVAGPLFFRVLSATWEIKREGMEHALESGNDLSYAVWHESIPAGVSTHCNVGMCVMISHHHDGSLIEKIARRFGYLTARGSSTRGGVGAIRKMLRDAAVAHGLVITPDGPQGPAHSVAPGLFYVSAVTRRPMVTISFASSKQWRVNKSWDRMIFPKPFAKLAIVYGQPFDIPRNVLDDKTATARAVEQIKDSFAAGHARAAQLVTEMSR